MSITGFGRKAILVALAAAVAIALTACGGGGRTTTIVIKDTGFAEVSSTKDSQDAAAKSNARNAVSQVETCFTEVLTYVGCKIPASSGLSIGSGDGQVEVGNETADTYRVTSHSKSGNVFVIERPGGGGAVTHL